MVNPNDIYGRKREIKNHLKSGKLERAINRLLDLEDDHFSDTAEEHNAIQLSARYYNIKKKVGQGLLPHDQETIRFNS